MIKKQEMKQQATNLQCTVLDTVIASVAKKKEATEMGKKHKNKDLAERCYDHFLYGNQFFDSCNFEEFLHHQHKYAAGDVIPEILDLNLASDSGFFFGTKYEPNGYVGKPASQDGHILVAGVPGSGKSMGVVIPTLMTWRGSQVVLDIKGNLLHYKHQLILILNKTVYPYCMRYAII